MEDAPTAARRCFVHVGLPKSGTSYLQSVLWQSREALRAQDVELLPSRQQDHFFVALQLRGLLADVEDERAFTAMERLTRQAARATAATAVLSQEALAPAKPHEVAALLEALAGYEVHVVVTARDIARQVPSAWQQRIQARHTYTFAEFVDAVVDRAPLVDDFWVNQDLVDVLERWSSHVPVERIHVVTTPRPGSPSELLLERFCSVVGIDPDGLSTSTASSNVALGLTQAELQRRVNVVLGDGAPRTRAAYGRVGKQYLAGRILRPQGGERPLMPERLRAWCEQTAEEWTQHIRDNGYGVVGDLDDLRPPSGAFTDSVADPTTEELLDAAVAALATVLEVRHGELAERAELRAELRRLRRELEDRRTEAEPLRRRLLRRRR